MKIGTGTGENYVTRGIDGFSGDDLKIAKASLHSTISYW